MRKFKCLLFVLKRSYIYYYVICMTVPLKNRQLLTLQKLETYSNKKHKNAMEYSYYFRRFLYIFS